ncbi:conserved repeat domain-containing protein/Por secretion system C-terminal sorting domain-containing protein [Mesonia phycicola]|uniref:Conserved repeat domain-containing protein/Por secretion system C-terminal sorting domain-containing protein n=1 Tax=Mesonia phycicola TaxID=579105 RepID=A0A1M6GIN1_9FLAO|nr:conserved repeat domain-containing protein/Por secretion system C-terminal sorting domain-containing protein [Mesonia phycicola]
MISLFTSAQNAPFITTWEVSSSDLEIFIPTEGTGYNYTVDFGDGTVLTNQTGDASHTYNSAGIYTVSISGIFPRIYFDNNPLNNNRDKIKTISQWGDISWQTMENSFYGCQYLEVNATDTPDLSQVTDLSYMFAGCSNFNQSINNWDVSNITDIKYMFKDASTFNQPLNNWDVSNVTDMSGVFWVAFDFNQPLDNWNISNVQKTYQMFRGATSFNQPLNNWDVSNVFHISFMFAAAESFNQPLNNWDITGTNSLGYMFYGAKAFNQNINNWDVSNITSLEFMFAEAENYNQPLNNWDVSSVYKMSYMFSGAKAFNQNINNWGAIADTDGMFQNAIAFNQPLNNWSPTHLDFMFEGAISFDQPLNTWDLSNIFSIKKMFYGASSFNQDLSSWDVSSVIKMDGTFEMASSFNQDLSMWNFHSNVFFGWGSTGTSSFIKESNLDVNNYDKLLNKFINLNITGKSLNSLNLEYCNQLARNYLINNLNWQIDGDNLSSNCNKIVGDIIYDENSNGCDQNDQTISGIAINFSNGSYSTTVFPDTGNYEIGVTGANFTVSLVNLPPYYTVTPSSQQVTFTTSNIEVADFCLTANQVVEDLNITLLPTSEARPGFDADYQLVVQNVGNQTIANPSISLVFDNTMQTYVSASQTPSSTTANQLNFDFTSIAPFESKIVDVTMNTFQPPTVNGDDILNFTASVTPNTNDYTPADNTFVYDQTVVNSFDPNDKQVLQGEEIYEDQTDEYLDYLIRFQNTGTASAINVRILDTLHPNLDYNTLKPINASHNYYIEISEGNQVEFIFDNINLPDETSDEAGSHGFVAYKIKPKSSVSVGDFITGDAQIYFDFNSPIITNMVSTEVIDNELSATEFDVSTLLRVYPNPTTGIINLHSDESLELQEVVIYNLQGKRLLEFNKNLARLNVQNLSTGIYLMSIKTNQGELNKRLIKK